MGGGLLGGHIPHLLPSPAAEWAAGGGEHNAINLGSRPGTQALGHGGVLGVDGNDLAGGGGFGDKRAPGDEGFFIGKGEGSADFDSGHGGGEPKGSDQRVEDGIAGDGFHQVSGGGGAGADGTAEGGGDSFGRLGVGDGNVVGVEPQGLGLVDDELGVRPAAAIPTTWNLSGLSAMTWSAWVPMDPVLPRIITCLTIFPIVSLLFCLWFLFVAVWLLLMGGVIMDEAWWPR